MSTEKADLAGRIAAEMVRRTTYAALATVDPDGHPFASLVALAITPDGAPLMLLSNLARHTRNLTGEARASLLLRDEAGDDPLAAGRLTLIGRIDKVGPDTTDAALGYYLARHPSAESYSGFGDFAVYRMTVESAYLVAGFGRIETVSRDALAAALAAAADDTTA